ncbi:hypothetical protein J5N97_008858 [Dioscorea zingiberensis]|uniref:Uncharacterized protein n=1 Tax=Dioscorea zingiberensis TaxID=325984 RepID=A0A9D5CY89_9LILI|nr:hypothetical protein J5N97_008858 [Dioscorea zingiberensis]
MASVGHVQEVVPLDVDSPVLQNTPPPNVHMRCRCMVHKLGCLIKMLNEEKKEVMRCLGFGGLLEAASYSLRMGLVEKLVGCLDPDTGILLVHGRRLHMTAEHAGSLLGFPTDGPDVSSKLGRDGTTDERFRIARSSLTPRALYTELIQLPEGQEFKGKLLLYIIATIIRPTSNVHVSTSYLSLLAIMDDIIHLNWAKYAYEGLLTAVRTYNNGRARRVSNKCIGGCIWLLQLFYLEHLAVGIIHQPIRDRQQPRVAFWTDTLIGRAVKHVNHRGGVNTLAIDVFSALDGSPHRAENYSAKSELTALKRELDLLRSHIADQLASLRHEMRDLIFGHIEAIRSELQASMRDELESVRSELADMGQMLHSYMARGEDTTETGTGISEANRVNEAPDADLPRLVKEVYSATVQLPFKTLADCKTWLDMGEFASAFAGRTFETDLVDLMVENGRNGRSNGKGYYIHEKGSKPKPDPSVLTIIDESRRRANIMLNGRADMVGPGYIYSVSRNGKKHTMLHSYMARGEDTTETGTGISEANRMDMHPLTSSQPTQWEMLPCLMMRSKFDDVIPKFEIMS